MRENGVESGEIELMQSGGTPSSSNMLGARDSVQGSYIGVRTSKLRLHWHAQSDTPFGKVVSRSRLSGPLVAHASTRPLANRSSSHICHYAGYFLGSSQIRAQMTSSRGLKVRVYLKVWSE